MKPKKKWVDIAALPKPDYRTDPRAYDRWRYARHKLGLGLNVCSYCGKETRGGK